MSEITVLAHRAHEARAANKRLWIEVRLEHQLGTAHYISLDPGEYRCQRPSASSDMIVVAPNVTDMQHWRVTISDAADQACADGFFASETLTRLIAQARSILESDHPDRPAFSEMKGRLNSLIADAGEDGVDPEVLQSLYQEAVLEFQLPARDFAVADLLLRAQLTLGFRFNCEITEIGADDLTRFLKTQAPAFVDGFVGFLAAMGKMTMSGGRDSVREALAQPTVYEFQRQLLHAVYCFSIAVYAATVVQGLGRADRLGYKPLVAEEAWVCTMTGLGYGSRLAMEGYESIINDIRLEVLANRVEGAYRVAHQYSSEVFPILPDAVLDVFVARALVENGGQQLREGVQKLDSIWQTQEYVRDGDYERSLIENGLLDGYKALGDHQKVQQMATRIAARMVVGSALKEGDGGVTRG